jgi:hypothetical protein
MKPDAFEVSTEERQRVRALVLDIQRDMECLAAPGTSEQHRQASDALAVSWAQLTAALSARGAEAPLA